MIEFLCLNGVKISLLRWNIFVSSWWFNFIIDTSFWTCNSMHTFCNKFLKLVYRDLTFQKQDLGRWVSTFDHVNVNSKQKNGSTQGTNSPLIQTAPKGLYLGCLYHKSTGLLVSLRGMILHTVHMEYISLPTGATSCYKHVTNDFHHLLVHIFWTK